MLTLLLAIDGSECSDRAVAYAIRRVADARSGARVELLNVQSPLAGPNVKLFVSQESLDRYYREEAEGVLQPALQRLTEAGVRTAPHIGLGEAGRVIADYAASTRSDEIVMGSRGRGALSGAVLGSVAQKVIHLSPVPVVVIK